MAFLTFYPLTNSVEKRPKFLACSNWQVQGVPKRWLLRKKVNSCPENMTTGSDVQYTNLSSTCAMTDLRFKSYF